MVFAVADDGHGFDPAANGRRRGIESIEEELDKLRYGKRACQAKP